MTKKRIILFTLVLFFLGILYFLRNRILETFETSAATDKSAAMKSIQYIQNKYTTLEKELKESNSLEKLYNTIPLNQVLYTTKEQLKTLSNSYRDHQITYGAVKIELTKLTIQFNKIISLYNVNMLNLRIDTIMPDLPVQKTGLVTSVYKSEDEYDVKSV